MKIKDLLYFNPETEVRLLGMDYVPIDLSIYSWSSGDIEGDTTEYINEVLVIPTCLEKSYSTEVEA